MPVLNIVNIHSLRERNTVQKPFLISRLKKDIQDTRFNGKLSQINLTITSKNVSSLMLMRILYTAET